MLESILHTLEEGHQTIDIITRKSRNAIHTVGAGGSD
jgi:hypothetical protein